MAAKRANKEDTGLYELKDLTNRQRHKKATKSKKDTGAYQADRAYGSCKEPTERTHAVKNCILPACNKSTHCQRSARPPR
jgi:hypothetical protein